MQGKAIRQHEQEKADAIAKLRGFTSEKWKAEVKKAVLAWQQSTCKKPRPEGAGTAYVA